MNTDIRKSRNLMRAVNEQIRDINTRFGLPDSTFLVLCECERPECFQRVEVPATVFEELRADGDRFVVIDGHEGAGDDRVVASVEGYAVVRAPAANRHPVEEIRARGPLQQPLTAA